MDKPKKIQFSDYLPEAIKDLGSDSLNEKKAYAQDLANKLMDALNYETDVIDLESIEEKVDEIFFKD